MTVESPCSPQHRHNLVTKKQPNQWMSCWSSVLVNIHLQSATTNLLSQEKEHSSVRAPLFSERSSVLFDANERSAVGVS